MTGAATEQPNAVAVARAFRTLHQNGFVPDYEKLLESAYRRILKPGSIVVEAGAHEGRHLKVFRECVGDSGKIIAFEPLPHLYKALVAAYRSDPVVRLHDVALGDRAGNETFRFFRNAPGFSGFKDRSVGMGLAPQIETFTVEVKLLDGMVHDLTALDYMKLDIEGAEISCLNGARATLARLRPIVSVEFGEPSYKPFGLTGNALYEFASSAGFVITDLFGNAMLSQDTWQAVCDCSYWDFFLVPREKLDDWQRSQAPI